MQLKGTLGFLGCGNMGGAILRGLRETGAVTPGQALVYDVDPAKRAEAAALGAEPVESPEILGNRCDTLLLAVKPQSMDEALRELKPPLPHVARVISIAAGISVGFIRSRLGESSRVIRVMPNTPALVGAGAAAFALGPGCTPADEEAVRTIFEAVGIAERVPEEALDIVTALSGSGPAYFFFMVECLVETATRQGLPPDQAMRLAAQTLLGAGRLLIESQESPSVLREKVTSKGGTTEAALNALRAARFDEVIGRAVDAAAARSRELGK